MSMHTLPDTTPEHYLTGHAALNIPTDDGDFADWHFSEMFLSGKARFVIAGRNFPDTTHLLSTYGIRECAEVLRRYGVHLQASQKVYAANYVRATLDLIIAAIIKGQIPHHVTIHDTLDEDAVQTELSEQLQHLKTRLTDPAFIALLEQWEQQQRP